MISFTSAEFNALLAAYLYPLARILALHPSRVNPDAANENGPLARPARLDAR